MKRRIWCAMIAPLLVLGGCRGVLGIEDLDVRADGGAGTTEAGTDSASGSDGTMGGDSSMRMDAIGDAPPPMPTIDAGCASSIGMACGMCCRGAAALGPGYDRLAQLAVSDGCVCGPTGACTATNECGSDLCVGGKAQMGCGGCLDMATRGMASTLTAACQKTNEDCKVDPDCSQVLFCEHSCNP